MELLCSIRRVPDDDQTSRKMPDDGSTNQDVFWREGSVAGNAEAWSAGWCS